MLWNSANYTRINDEKKRFCTWPLYLFFNPSLQLVHFLVELLQTPGSTEGPLLIGSCLFKGLPLISELTELLPHQIRGGVCLADQLLAHLLTVKGLTMSATQRQWRSPFDTPRSDSHCLYAPVRLRNVGSLPFSSWTLRTPVPPLPFLGCLSVSGG